MKYEPGPGWTTPIMRDPNNTVILDRIKFGMTKIITDTAMTGLRASVTGRRGYEYYESMGATAMIKMRVDLLGHQHPPQTIRNTVLVPRLATPWQHFRARHWDKWWMMWARKRPLQYVDEPVPVTVDVRSQTLYPHHQLALDDTLGASALRFETSHARSIWEQEG